MPIHAPISKDFEHYHIGTGKISNLKLEQRLFEKFRLASPIKFSDVVEDGFDATPISADYMIEEYHKGLVVFKRVLLGRFRSSKTIPYSDAIGKLVSIQMAKSYDEAFFLLNDITEYKRFRYNNGKYLLAQRKKDPTQFYLDLSVINFPDYT